LTDELSQIKLDLSKQKRLREKRNKKYHKLKQQTGIVSQNSLKMDHAWRTGEIKRLEKEISVLNKKHTHIQNKIDQARPYQTRGYGM